MSLFSLTPFRRFATLIWGDECMKSPYFLPARAVLALMLAVCAVSFSACSKGASPAKNSSGSGPSSGTSAPPETAPSPSSGCRTIDGFVRITDLDSSIVIDLKYATADNFTHRKVYPADVGVLRLGTAQKLAKANDRLKEKGYRIKVWDAYRPVSVQKLFWSLVPDTNFVADPSTGGSIHNKGCAVDVTLVDRDGKEVEMPSGFDDFTEKAYRSNSLMSSEAESNLALLTEAMTASGFMTIDTEWWHFEDIDRDEYENADVDLSLFQ